MSNYRGKCCPAEIGTTGIKLGVYLNATVKDKKVKLIFRKPFDSIEKLAKLAKQGIAEIGFSEFKSAIISSYPEYVQSTKKAPEGANFVSTTCFKWWTLRNNIRTLEKGSVIDFDIKNKIFIYSFRVA